MQQEGTCDPHGGIICGDRRRRPAPNPLNRRDLSLSVTNNPELGSRPAACPRVAFGNGLGVRWGEGSVCGLQLLQVTG